MKTYVRTITYKGRNGVVDRSDSLQAKRTGGSNPGIIEISAPVQPGSGVHQVSYTMEIRSPSRG
jgi:hypothetical protein